MNKDYVHTIYFDPQKHPVCNKFKGEGYSLLSKDLISSAINHGYQIVKNDLYIVGDLTANRFPVAYASNTNVTLNVDK